MPNQAVLNTYRPQVQAYAQTAETEPWKEHFDQAQACQDLEQILLVGVGLYEMLNRADEGLRLAAARGKIAYDESVERAFEVLFEWWLGPCDHLEAQIQAFEKLSFKVENAQDFRERVALVKATKADVCAED